MTSIQKGISSLAFVVFIASGLPVHAATVTVPTVTVGANASAQTSAPAAAHSDTSVTAGTILNGGLGPHATISNITTTPVSITTGKDAIVAANAAAAAKPSAAATKLSISRSSAMASASSTEHTAVKSSSAVLTKDDLNSYVSLMVAKEDKIRAANFTDSSVQLKYAEPGKLFGFIPVMMTATAASDAKGNVTVKYPWYHFMVTARNSDDVATNVAAYTKLMLDHVASTTDSTNFTVRAQAHLFDELRLALEGSGQAETYGTTGQ